MTVPLISVIIPTYNDGKDLSNAIQTVMNQECPEGNSYNLEIIVVDDASDEQNFKLTEQVVKDNELIRLIRCEENGGPAKARNIGIKESKGEIIAFIDADDLWPTNKLMVLIPLLLNDDSIEVVGGKVKYLMNEGREIGIDLWEDEEKRLTHVHLGALLVKRGLFEKDLYFDEAFRFSEDADWWLRIREEKTGIIIIEETTLLYRIHDSNMTKEATIQDLNLLKVLHKSLKRRKEKGIAPVIPQIRDFRKFREEPLISIVFLIQNETDGIENTIKSILGQTYLNKELIIINNSTEINLNDLGIINPPEIRVISSNQTNIGNALNIGINSANGEIIAFIEQHDEWLPEKLKRQWEVLKNNPYCVWTTCNKYLNNDPVKIKSDIFELGNQASLGSLVVRKHSLTDIKGFTPNQEINSFEDITNKLRKGNYPFIHINEIYFNRKP